MTAPKKRTKKKREMLNAISIEVDGENNGVLFALPDFGECSNLQCEALGCEVAAAIYFALQDKKPSPSRVIGAQVHIARMTRGKLNRLPEAP